MRYVIGSLWHRGPAPVFCHQKLLQNFRIWVLGAVQFRGQDAGQTPAYILAKISIQVFQILQKGP